MNAVINLMAREMGELELGLSGALNISDSMDTLITNLYTNKVPPAWLKVCGQIGPTGTYNRKPLGLWFSDLLLRQKQLKEWSDEPETLPPCVWISGLFNPMGYITACLQVTARAKGLPLDSMVIATEVLRVLPDAIEAQPEEGTYIHGLFMEGARWDSQLNTITDSQPKVRRRSTMRAAAMIADAQHGPLPRAQPRDATRSPPSTRPPPAPRPRTLCRSSSLPCPSYTCEASPRTRCTTTAPTNVRSTPLASAGRRSRSPRRCGRRDPPTRGCWPAFAS
jgi:hypothetical protein